MKRKQRGSTEEVLPQSSGLHARLKHTHTHTSTGMYSHTRIFSHPHKKLSHTCALTNTPRHMHAEGLQQGLLGNIRHPGRKEDRLFPHLDSMDTSDVRLKIEPMLTKPTLNQLQQMTWPALCWIWIPAACDHLTKCHTNVKAQGR